MSSDYSVPERSPRCRSPIDLELSQETLGGKREMALALDSGSPSCMESCKYELG
jgi:hypothetical protein